MVRIFECALGGMRRENKYLEGTSSTHTGRCNLKYYILLDVRVSESRTLPTWPPNISAHNTWERTKKRLSLRGLGAWCLYESSAGKRGRSSLQPLQAKRLGNESSKAVFSLSYVHTRTLTHAYHWVGFLPTSFAVVVSLRTWTGHA